MKPFIHIITTRFNVPTKSWDIMRDGKTPLSEKWHEHRFEVFQKYTLSSFKNLSNQNFVWLVFFDVNTAPKYKEIIHSIQKKYPKFTPIFIREFSEMQPWIINFITENTAYFQFVITSDIDNDDLLHRKFTEKVQEMFQPIHDLVIDVRTGIQLEVQEKKANVFLVNMAASPFVSLVEEISKSRSIIKEPYHSSYRKYSAYTFYDKEPLFIQYIHPYNMVNDTRTENKRLYYFDFTSFGMTEHPAFKISATKTFKHNLKRMKRLIWNRFLKIINIKY